MLNLFPIDPDIRIAGLTIENLRPSADESKFDLTLYIIKERQDFLLKLVYNAGLFDEIRMKEMLDQFVSLLRQIVAEPDRVIDSYSLLTDTSRRLFPDPSRDIPEPTTIPVVNDFVARVREAPQRIAVEQSTRSWTYEELLSRASTVATALVAQGVQPAEVGPFERPQHRIGRRHGGDLHERRRPPHGGPESSGEPPASAPDRSAGEVPRVHRRMAAGRRLAERRARIDDRPRAGPGRLRTCARKRGFSTRDLAQQPRVHFFHLRHNWSAQGCTRKPQGSEPFSRMAEAHVRRRSERPMCPALEPVL